MKAAPFVAALIIATSLLGLRETRAAACCGGGAAIPSLIAGDTATQISSAISHGTVIGDAPATGIPIWRADNNVENVQNLQVDASTLIGETWQAGVSAVISKRDLDRPTTKKSASGLGDTRLTAAWEFLPEYSYSKWKPNGFLYAQATLPTGKSIYESNDPTAVDATGKGFYQAGLGSIFLKRFGKWDAATALGLRWGFERTFNTADGRLTVRPGLSTEGMFGGGYSPASIPWRFGASLAVNYNEPGLTRGEFGDSPIAAKQVWDTGLDASWSVASHSSLIFAYNDQTIWGPAANTSLMRTFSVRFSQRWDR